MNHSFIENHASRPCAAGAGSEPVFSGLQAHGERLQGDRMLKRVLWGHKVAMKWAVQGEAEGAHDQNLAVTRVCAV